MTVQWTAWTFDTAAGRQCRITRQTLAQQAVGDTNGDGVLNGGRYTAVSSICWARMRTMAEVRAGNAAALCRCRTPGDHRTRRHGKPLRPQKQRPQRWERLLPETTAKLHRKRP